MSALTLPQAVPEDSDTSQALAAAEATLLSSPNYRVLRRFTAPDVGGLAYQPRRPAGALRAAILDTETTGVDTTNDRLIELGMLVFDFDPTTGNVLGMAGAYSGLEDPGMLIPAKATRVNKITDEHVKGLKLDDRKVLALAQGVDLVISHNAEFDRHILEPRLPLFEALPWACSMKDIDWEAEGVGGRKLDYLAYLYGFFYEGHRATADCFALLEILRQPLPGTGVSGILALYEAAARPRFVLYAAAAPFDKKALLKGRGYRWTENARILGGKAWGYTAHDELELLDEADWLRENVYGGRKFKVSIEQIDARVAYSPRGGVFRVEDL